MKVFDGNWKAFAARTVVFGVVVFGAVRLAVARPGVAGGPARSFVTVAGTLANVPGPSAMITFDFQRREGSTMTMLCSQTVTAQLGSGGAFSVSIPVATSESTCPEDIFDGRDVWVRATVGSVMAADWAPVNPVPYAHFASVAGTANVATQYGTPDCPVGYARTAPETAFPSPSDGRICQRTGSTGAVVDVVVRVGSGPSAFWIDRYEATVWSDRDGNTTPYGTSGADYPTSFPVNGQWSRAPRGAPMFALSRTGYTPSQFITWFQAQAACRASGKRLPTHEEWFAAALGTHDPTTSERAVSGSCNVGSGGSYAVRLTGSVRGPSGYRSAVDCVSNWGAEDMIGNVSELDSEWHLSPLTGSGGSSRREQWPTEYGGDATWGVSSYAYPTYPSMAAQGLPAVTWHGGSAGDEGYAGLFTIYSENAPSNAGRLFGFRCVIPR